MSQPADDGRSGERSLHLTGRDALKDLATYVGRAGRVDAGGAARLVAHGEVVAVFVSPVHGGGGPTVMGLRAVRLAEPADVDTTVLLASLSDRFARIISGGLVGPDAPVRLPLPPQEATDVPWAGMTPPRSGWEVVGTVPGPVLREAARAGVEEVAAGAGEGSGAQAVARLRALVWGRDLEGVAGLPTGAAFAADALGFLGADEPVALHRTGAWRRLTTRHGHVLARSSLLADAGTEPARRAGTPSRRQASDPPCEPRRPDEPAPPSWWQPCCAVPRDVVPTNPRRPAPAARPAPARAAPRAAPPPVPAHPRADG